VEDARVVSPRGFTIMGAALQRRRPRAEVPLTIAQGEELSKKCHKNIVFSYKKIR